MAHVQRDGADALAGSPSIYIHVRRQREEERVDEGLKRLLTRRAGYHEIGAFHATHQS